MLMAAARRKIAASIRARPLMAGEVRRIEGMGGHYICLADTDLSDEFAEMASFEFKGTPMLFVRQTGDGS